jgi:NAD(P)-dependent dehydrogenase (short-subunit alcohol dehydrogenase family)
VSYDGKVAIVTGGAGGMGSVMSLALARAGLKVAVVDINAQSLNRLAAAAATERLQDRVRPFAVDIGDRAACASLVPKVIAELGGLHVLVNNAGIGMQIVDPEYSVKPPRFWESGVEGWQRLFDVNVRAPLILAQAAAHHMLGQKWGRIVNVTTSFDTMLAPKVWAYGQAKAALEAASAGWAGGVKDTGVTVNVLIPGGPVDTPLLPPNTDLPRAKLIRPEVMAAPICWLASDDADGFNNRRIIAREWNAAIPPREAAERCSDPIAWPGFGRRAVMPG